MKKSELMDLLKDIDENADINEKLQGIEGLIKPFDVAEATTDDLKNMLANNKAIKAYWQSSFDSKVSNSINTWKENNLQGLIDKAVKEKSNEGLTDEQKQIKALNDKLAQMEAEKQRNEQINAYKGKLKEANLSENLAKYIQEDADIEFFQKLFGESNTNAIKNKLGDSNYTPPTTPTTGKLTWEQVVANPSLYADWQKENKQEKLY